MTARTLMHRAHRPPPVRTQADRPIVASSKVLSAVRLAEMVGTSYQTARPPGIRALLL